MKKVMWLLITSFTLCFCVGFLSKVNKKSSPGTMHNVVHQEKFEEKSDPSGLSITDFIRLNGQPDIANGALYLWDKNIVSLEGIENLPNKENIIALCLDGNNLQLSCKDEERFSGFINLTHLGLSNNQLTAIPDDIFKNLNTLHSLDLSYNKLKELPAGIFNNLSSLEHLNLNVNEFTTLDPNIFSYVCNLKKLDLAGAMDMNGGCSCIEIIPKDLFANLINLEELDLSANFNIKELDLATFNNLTRLKRLNLSHTVFLLKKGLLHNLSSLIFLELNGCGENVETGSFDGLINLAVLEMGLGELGRRFFWIKNSLPNQLFQPLVSLELLNLSFHDIQELDASTFQGLKNLKYLYLDSIGLISFDPEVCEDLISLEYLSLKGNKLVYIDPRVISQLASLETINVQGNFLFESNRKELLAMNADLTFKDIFTV